MNRAWMALVFLGVGGLAHAQAPVGPVGPPPAPPGYGYAYPYPYGVVPAGCAACGGAPAASSYGPSGFLPVNLTPQCGPSPPPGELVPQGYRVQLPPRKPWCNTCKQPKCFDNSLDANTPNAFDMDCPCAHKHWFGF